MRMRNKQDIWYNNLITKFREIYSDDGQKNWSLAMLSIRGYNKNNPNDWMKVLQTNR